MAGKRLLDAARLLDASGSIVKQHFSERRQQWNTFSGTSAVVKVIKQQTDRVTVTARAALELSRRLNEDGNATAGQYQEEKTIQPTKPPHPLTGLKGGISNLNPSDERSDLRDIQSPSKQDAQAHPGMSTSEQQSFVSSRDRLSHAPGRPLADASLVKNQVAKDTEQGLSSETMDNMPNIAGSVFTSANVAHKLGFVKRGVENPYSNRARVPPQPLPEMRATTNPVQQNLKSQETLMSTPEPTLPQIETKQSLPNELEKASFGDASQTAEPFVEDIQISQEVNPANSSMASAAAPQESQMRESSVPSTRFGRLWQYGSLATGLTFGAVGESFRRMAGGSQDGSFFLNDKNMTRLVTKLSRMRGAALKLGQMISFQDSKVLPLPIQTVLQRVQDSADYMPSWQRDKVLSRNLGDQWRDLFASFEEKPFAAASIGQVHKATLKSNGQDVAVKVQYPGVRGSIDSDLNNLSLLLNASQLLPRGLFLDRTIANARTELGWECDYEREAKACMRFKNELLHGDQTVFTVPTVHTDASGPDVLTMEFMKGTAVTKIHDLEQQERDWIGTQLLRLCLRELMEWQFMQTDPNWTNFLWNRDTQRIELLDFGASRDFSSQFVEPYVALLIAASKGDRETCRDRSIELGYLNGQESPAMLKAHVDSILTLAEPFVNAAPEVYDFHDQTITDRVRANIGIMLRERLAPPPEETYSLHRKLSGAFLLCAKLRSRVRAKDLFQEAIKTWNGRST